ncbi:hypothetical protein J421_2369 [Gemmatirosa kalamazoonensis]|uniref:Cytochrome c domain-containing protein n=1 Tax=Gemmatirosa kalamazoonensis TaxID=861299 RepID=W0RGJ6_9BACT|nr:cytochrome c [Gemmatirosa kalamazoonensis]AHG89906.1 hypothetical protein J421_2369 [Gemmatirosa kalamazoonensis]
MSPPRRAASGGSRGSGGRPRRGRKRSRAVPIALAFLGIVAAASAGLALYLGFLPGPDALFGRRGADRLPDDSTLASSVAPHVGASDAPALDTAPMPAPAAIDSTPTDVVTVADSVAGDAVYHGTGRCVGCHGPIGEGAPGLGPSLRLIPGRLTDGSVAAIAQVITRGAPPSPSYRVAMPSYAGQLSAEDVRRLAAYVRTLSQPGTTPDTAHAGVPAPKAPAPTTVPRPTVPPPPDAAAGAVNADAPVAGAAARAPVRRPTVPPPPPAPRRP